jgi:hypothetical protein
VKFEICPIFRHTGFFATQGRTLKLYLDFDSTPTFPGQNGEISGLLSSAKHLEDLELDVKQLIGSRDDFDNIIGFTTWPSLTRVCFMAITDDSFLPFCRRSQKSIRHMALERIRLYGGSWATLIEGIGNCLKLKEVYLESLMEGEDQDLIWRRLYKFSGPTDNYYLVEAERYVLLGGENPFKQGLLRLAHGAD